MKSGSILRVSCLILPARAYAISSDKKKALAALKLAVEKGFADAAALESNEAFAALRPEAEFQKIAAAFKKKTRPTHRIAGASAGFLNSQSIPWPVDITRLDQCDQGLGCLSQRWARKRS